MSDPTETTAGAAPEQRLARRRERFDAALAELAAAPPFAKARYQTPVYRLAADLMESDEGFAHLAARADRFDGDGVFHGGPWERPDRLVPDLVGVGLRGEGVYPIVEALSELRLLALAAGRVPDADLEPAAAREFLRDVCAKNLDLMFPAPGEETRRRPGVFDRAERLFRLVRREITLTGLRRQVAEEIEALAAQRPIQTGPIRRLLRLADRLPADDAEDEATDAVLDLYRTAVGAVTAAGRAAGDPVAYRAVLQDADAGRLEDEARAHGASLEATGLGSPYHAVLLRRLATVAPPLLGPALALNTTGLAELEKRGELVTQLVKVAIHPATADAILGLKRVCERGLLSRSEVAGGLRRLIDLQILPAVRDVLLATHDDDDALTANAVLVGGTLSVLGQPLGVGQGNNPTCQAARGISLWSLHAPGLLLGMIAEAARDGLLEMRFEAHELKTSLLGVDPAAGADLDLDPVSTVLVPHLDRLYAQLMQLAGLRGEDAHKWVNPALYGRWVDKGFAATIDPAGTTVRGHEAFVRRFYATHHPDYNDGHELIYPNPVGILVTNAHADLLGPHAVSLQRVARTEDGELRAYFFNPNNEGRQNWGQGIAPSVTGRGERPGESSLPFAFFASRLYAFHYNPYEEGDAFAVPAEEVAAVTDLARESWGRAYTWIA